MGIPDYFSDKKILITGATGFMGKALVEKLLRSCPEVSTIYVIIRPKKGSSPEKRWAEITKLPLFDRLKLEQPNSLGKVMTIAGESTANDFGLKEEDRQMLIDNVNLIFNVAASVRFDDGLASAIKLNVKSTYSIMEMAKNMKHLECVLHTSTAFTHYERTDEVEERMYESPLDWRTMLTLAEDVQYQDVLPAIQPKIMSGHATTYTLTKRIAESLVEEYGQYFPVVLMRPVIVYGTMEDPFPGWIDSHNGTTLMCDAVRCGYLRVLNANPEARLHGVSLDLAIKAFLIATWKAHKDQTKSGVSVYCESMGAGMADGTMSFRDVKERFVPLVRDYPAVGQLWYPFFIIATNPFVYFVLFFLLQSLPALVADLIRVANGLKPKLWRLTVKMYAVLTGVSPGFIQRQFHFSTHNYRSLDSILTPDDRKNFSLDQSNYGAMEVYKANLLGGIRYIAREDLSQEALEKRGQRMKLLKVAHYTSCAVVIAICSYSALNYFPSHKLENL